MMTGFLHDIRNGISCDTFSGKLPEASCSYCVLSDLLPNTYLTLKLIW